MFERKVSIIVPVFNGEKYLQESVESALAQTHEDLEVVIVNDGSTDSSGDIADDLANTDKRVVVVHQVNKGLSAARNTGLTNARGGFVNFLDSDDWMLDRKLELQLAALDANPDYGLVYSDYIKRQGDQEFQVDRGLPPLPFKRTLAYRNWFAPMVPLVRRKLIDQVGEFDTSMRASEDWDYWYRCAELTEFLYLPGVLAAYRLHESQMTKDRSRMEEGQKRFADKHLMAKPEDLRAFRTYQHMARAKHAKATKQYVLCMNELRRFVLCAGSLKEARFVWKMPP